MNENFLHQAAKASAELFHSNMLAYLWQKYPDLANSHLSCGIPPDAVHLEADTIERERLNFDILVVTDSHAVAIENKFKSRHTDKQLQGYRDRLETAYGKLKGQRILVALCTTHRDAQETKARIPADLKVTFISYEVHVVGFLQAVIARAEKNKDERSLFYLRDYLEVIQDLLELVETHEGTSQSLGAALQQIADDTDVARFRLGPLMQRRLFEQILEKLKASLGSAAEIKELYEVNDIGLGHRSKLGQITVKLQTPVVNPTYLVHVGLQLEGKQLRRFVTFERQGSSMSEQDKRSVHRLATAYARQHCYFEDVPGDAVAPIRPQHFNAAPALDPFLAYENSNSVFFIYLNLTSDCGAQTIDGVEERLKKELDRLEARRAEMSVVV